MGSVKWLIWALSTPFLRAWRRTKIYLLLFLKCVKFIGYLEHRQWHFKSGATRQLEAPRGVAIFHYSHFRWHFHSNRFHCWQNRHKPAVIDILLHELVAGWKRIVILNCEREISDELPALGKKRHLGNDYCGNLIAIRHRGESVTTWTVRVVSQWYRGVFWEMGDGEHGRGGGGREEAWRDAHWQTSPLIWPIWSIQGDYKLKYFHI